MRLSLCLVLAIICIAHTAWAISDTEIDQLTSYATILGRGVGCGVPTARAAERVDTWLNRVIPPGSEDRKIYLPIFATGIKYHADQQRAGHSPDSCATLRRTFHAFPWP